MKVDHIALVAHP